MATGTPLKGVRVNSIDYPFDYDYLANKPTMPSGLPDASGASEGDVLAIDSNGDPEWATPSSGGVGLPTCSTDGWVLTAATTGVEWTPVWTDPNALSSALPTTGMYESYILAINHNGRPAWRDPEIPNPGDVRGLVLTTTSAGHGYGWLPIGSENLPTCNTEGWVLTHTIGNPNVVWRAVSGALPTTSGAFVGDALVIDDNGHPAWGTVDGSSVLPWCSTAGWVLTHITNAPFLRWVDPATLIS